MREGALDHRRFENCRADLHLAASVRAALEVDLEVDLEHALEQPGNDALLRTAMTGIRVKSVRYSIAPRTPSSTAPTRFLKAVDRLQACRCRQSELDCDLKGALPTASVGSFVVVNET